ncbi:MAG: GTPase [Planctomycetota bacterium]
MAGGELKILHGSIVDNHRVIDEVVVGCEGEGRFVIHCHGNPLLVEQIVTLLQSNGAILIDADSFAAKNKFSTMIEAEARLAMRKSATLVGVKLLQSQIDGGLSMWAKGMLEQTNSLDTEAIKQQCRDILEQSVIARRIIEGVRIVIAGPPNSGKSTLLNCLGGQKHVIVSDTAGTTRDWVSVTARLGDGLLCAEFIDTAGLDEILAGNDKIEQSAQAITRELLESCDLVLYVRDITQQAIGDRQWAEDTIQAPVIYVNNKCDLAQEPGNAGIQEREHLSVSAKDNKGIDVLAREVLDRLGVVDFDVTNPAAFTERQCSLLLAIINAGQQPEKILSDLLYSKDR